jgi:hypothetical protein
MKHFDDMMRQHAPRPRRELRANFTKDTLSKLAQPPHKRSFGLTMENITMHFKTFTRLHRPAAIALAVIGTIVISGTATAATLGWPNVLAIFGSEQKLSDGSRIVQVDTKNCHFATAMNMIQQRNSPDSTYYYKVNADSKLTNEELTRIVQGYCDMEAQSFQNMAALKSEGHHFASVVGGAIDNVITAITPDSLTVKFDMPIAKDNKVTVETHSMTFTHIDPNAAIFDRGNRISFSDLRVGDHIALSYQAGGDAWLRAETPRFWESSPDEMSVVLIFKNTADMSAALKYQQYQNTDFEEVAKCDKNPSGYCTVEQLNQK